jgi:hypothetical protein
MPDIRDGLMCKQCRDWPKMGLRLAKRREWGRTITQMAHDGALHDDDLLPVLLLLDDPAVLDRLCIPPPADLSADTLLEFVGIK